MAIAAVRLRAHTERGFAHFNERRSPVFSTAASASATSVAPTQAIKLPTSVKALSGIIVVLGLVILAIAFWKIRAWRRRRRDAASNLTPENEKKTGFSVREIRIDLEAPVVTEKPIKAYLLPPIPPVSSGIGWVPQLKPDIAVPEPTRPRSQRAKKAWEKNLAKLIAPTVADRSPPPSYVFSSHSTVPRAMPRLPPMPLSPPRHSLPPTPPAALKLKFDSIGLPPTQTPVTSPVRNSSYGSDPILAPRLSSSSPKSDKKLPRLMNVSDAFDPSMNDELLISVGETVRLLEEYEDEWCLVQRVGRIDAAKGIVPRFCLSERPEFVPQHPGLPSAGAYLL